MSFLFNNLPEFRRHRGAELVIDSFAGGGGASTGIEMALGRSPDLAINHNAEAVAMHTVNHPAARHFCQNVWQVDPLEVCGGRPVGLAWFSPDCKHFSKAKGGKPVEKRIRDLAWVVVHWAKQVRPRVIFLENVEEFQTWGPLDGEDQPDAERKGETFQRWVKELRRLGYKVAWRELRACDYGAPTIRKRLFLIARCDGLPIVWPEPTHGKTGSGLLPYRTAAEIIDWSIPCPSIFERKRPLAEATTARIAAGMRRFVFEASEPFIVTCNHSGDGFRGQGMTEPFKTITSAHDAHGLVVPYITKFQENSIGTALDEPLHTVMAGAPRHGLVTAFLAKHYGGVVGHGVERPIGAVTTIDHHSVVTAQIQTYYGAKRDGEVRGCAADGLLGTQTTENRHALVTSQIVKLRGTCKDGQPILAPLPTITAGGTHIGEVRAFLIKYYGSSEHGQSLRDPLHTVTAKHRMGLVTIEGQDWQVVDIGMRMLSPRELFRAQGFPEGYVIDFEHNGRPLSKAAQVRMCGNSVCPPIAAALVRANYVPAEQMAEAAE
jgi:DNA (cytosine-5)-methyltransferase 1